MARLPTILLLVLWPVTAAAQANTIVTNQLVTKVSDYYVISAPPVSVQGACRFYVDGTSLYMSCNGGAYTAFTAAGGAAPTNAQYWTGAADATLSAEKNLGAVSTGLVINTAGVPSAYTGTSCTNQFPRSLDASGAATCASVANADLANSSITIQGSAVSLGGSTLATNSSPQFGSLLLGGTAFGSLGTPTDGTIKYCSDCDPVAGLVCASAGTKTGAMAFRTGGNWVCVGL